jgi:pseudouridine kinase
MDVVVIGAAHWDVVARAAAPLAAGADVPGRVVRRVGGVAANVALGLARAGRAVRLRSAIGDDAEGAALVAALVAGGVAAVEGRRAGTTDAYVVIEDKDGEVHAAVADCAGLERAGPGLLAEMGRPGAVVADGNLTEATLDALVGAAPGAVIAFVAASPEKAPRLAGAVRGGRGVLYLNRREAERLAGRAFGDSGSAATALVALGAARAVVTDGPRTASDAGKDGCVTRVPVPIGRRSLTGAGDAFVAAHLDAVLAGEKPAAALDAGLAASARHIVAEVAL